MSSGDLRSVPIYNYLSLKLVSEEVKKNPTATAVIDCPGGLVSDLWISSSSEMARRSLETRKKKPKISGDGKRILVDVLNFHIVFHMPSEGAERMPFAACESVIVERTAIVFEDILRRFRGQLLNFGQGSEHIRFFVTDMAVPLAAAVISVFNNMIITEYMAIRLFAAKVDDFSLNDMLIRTTLVWCGVHGDRAFKDYAREAYKKSEENLQRDMILFFRNLRMALTCTKTYKDLCMTAAFLDELVSLPTFRTLSHDTPSKKEVVMSHQQLESKGEQMIWKHLGGTPSTTDPRTVHNIRRTAAVVKGFFPSGLEVPFAESEKEDTAKEKGDHENSKKAPDTEAVDKPKIQPFESELEALEKVSTIDKGVYCLKYGPFDIYVVFRELNKDSNRARYRIYIPALSLIPGSIGGYSFWCESRKGDFMVPNEAFLGGKTSNYLRTQWYPNVSLFCPVFTGPVPLSHNTAVEVSFKKKKHHTDIGVMARGRGGMNISEYVHRTATESGLEAIRVAGLQSEIHRGDLEARRRKRTEKLASSSKPKKQKLYEIVKQTNTILANNEVVSGVLLPKERDGSEQKESNGFKGEEVIPVTQKSEKHINAAEETWAKTRRKRKSTGEDEKRSFEEVFISAKPEYLNEWKQTEVASFLNHAVLSRLMKRVDGPVISRILSRKKVPGHDIRSAIERFCTSELPKRSVDNEDGTIPSYINMEQFGSYRFSTSKFCILPGAKLRLHKLLTSPTPEERSQTLAKFGDAQVKLEDIKRMLRPLKLEGQDPTHSYFGDESVNLWTNLLTQCNELRDVYCFNSQTLRCFHLLVNKSENYQNKTAAEIETLKKRLLANTVKGRVGQRLTFDECNKAFAPVNEGQHWFGFRVYKDSNNFDSTDSLHRPDMTEPYSRTIKEFFELLTAEEWEFKGLVTSFPRQENGMDCGVFMLLSARCLRYGSELSVDMVTNEGLLTWRERFAHEILTLRAS